MKLSLSIGRHGDVSHCVTAPQSSNIARFLLTAFAVTGGLIWSASAAFANNPWSSFQNGGRLSLSEATVASNWTTEKNIAWSADISGYGQSSPVVWQDRVFVTSVSGEMKDTYHVTAFGLKDGKQLWQYDVANPSPRKSTNYVSRAAPTPAADADGVICFFEGGSLVALNHAGKPRWERNLVEESGPLDERHGLSASVEQNDDSVFVWVERGKDPYVLCINKQTGENKWKVAGLGVTSWASPRLLNVPAGQHLVLSGVGKLAGLNPATGEKLWEFTDIAGNSSPTPMPVGEGKFLIGATVGRGRGDTSGAVKSNGLIQVAKSDDAGWSARYVWQSKRATSSFGSPIAHNGLAYFVNRTGVLYALDLESGDEVYAKRLGQSTWATPLAIGDSVYFFGSGGDTTVIAAGKEFDVKHTSRCWEKEETAERFSGPVLYGVALAETRLLVRRGDRLWCIAKTDTTLEN